MYEKIREGTNEKLCSHIRREGLPLGKQGTETFRFSEVVYERTRTEFVGHEIKVCDDILTFSSR